MYDQDIAVCHATRKYFSTIGHQRRGNAMDAYGAQDRSVWQTLGEAYVQQRTSFGWYVDGDYDEILYET